MTRHGGNRIARGAFVAPALPFAWKTADNPEGVDKAVQEKMRADFSNDFPGWLAANARPFFLPETPDAMLQWAIGIC